MIERIIKWCSSEFALHMLWSFLIAVFVGHYTNWWISILVTLVIGIAKEVYDSTRPGNFFDWKDLLFDCLGIGLAMIIVLA